MIDYHAHLAWDNKTNTFYPQECIEDMNLYGIEKRVLSALNGYDIPEQNNQIADMVRKYPNRIIGCAVINPKEQGCLDEMRRIIELGCFKAIELDSFEHNYIPETMIHLDEIMQLAIENDLLVNVYTGWGCRTMPAQWAYYAKKYPKLTMIFLHMGTTDFGYGCIETVKQFDNCYIETSYMYELPILRIAFKELPIEKFLFGTHYPNKFTKCSVDTFDLLMLNEQQKAHLFEKNAKHLLKIK